jgi:hypothetical protein
MVDHINTVTKDRVPPQVVRRPMPGHRGRGDEVHSSAIMTAADARTPMARKGILGR